MYKQFDQLRRMPERCMERGIFAAEMWVLSDSQPPRTSIITSWSCRWAKCCYFFSLWKWITVEFSKVAGKDMNEQSGKVNELCFVVECFILCRNKFTYWLRLHGVMRPYQGYVQKQKKEPSGSRQVRRTLQIWSCLTSLLGFGGVQCVPVGK